MLGSSSPNLPIQPFEAYRHGPRGECSTDDAGPACSLSNPSLAEAGGRPFRRSGPRRSIFLSVRGQPQKSSSATNAGPTTKATAPSPRSERLPSTIASRSVRWATSDVSHFTPPLRWWSIRVASLPRGGGQAPRPWALGPGDVEPGVRAPGFVFRFQDLAFRASDDDRPGASCPVAAAFRQVTSKLRRGAA